MKRLTVILLVLLTPLCMTAGDVLAAAPAGNVVLVRGTAAILQGEQARPARKKDAVAESDTVTTGERSRLKLLFRNDSILTLGSKGRLVVRQYLESPGQKRTETAFELADGKLRAVVGSGSFRITTPTAYAAARGTVFVIWYDPVTSTTGIAVIEGGLEIRNIRHGDDRAVILTAGQLSRITGSDGPTPPEPFSMDLWGGAEATPLDAVLYELAELSEQGNDEPIEDTDDLVSDLEGEGPGQGEEGVPGGDGNGNGSAPPDIEPPIDQQPPPPPVTAPITVDPVFP